MNNLTFTNSVLSSLVTLFADTFGFASSTSSTVFLTATVWLEVASIFIQTEGRMPGAKLPTPLPEHFSFPWRFPIQALTRPGCFAYKIWQDHSLKWKDYWKMLSLPSDTWLGQELGVQNLETPLPLVLWECKHHHHHSRHTSQLIIVSQRQ